MMGSNGCGRRKLCPVSLGLALGITGALAFLIWMLWVTNYGPTFWMEAIKMPVPDWHQGWTETFWCFIKGFIFGFFLALIYNFFSWCCHHCCRKCSCSCPSCCGKSEDKEKMKI